MNNSVKEDKVEKVHGNKKLIDFNVLEALLQFKVSKVFVADYMGVSPDTIENRIREKYDMTYTELSNLRIQGTGHKLQQKAIEMALDGDGRMMQFALKNLSNWVDRVEQKIETTLTLEDLLDQTVEE
jgi:hypothetical protein